MKGTRPLMTDEIIAVSNQFDGTYKVRNRGLFFLGVSVGGRISELLSLRIGDVYQNGQPVSDLLFEKGMVKGKETARMIPVNEDGRQAISELIRWHQKEYGNLDPRRSLFTSRKHDRAISRVQAHRILEKAFQSARLNGKLATHSMRKTYAQRMYDTSGDIFLVKEALGHKSVETTKQYLGVSYSKMQAASKAIELSSNKSENKSRHLGRGIEGGGTEEGKGKCYLTGRLKDTQKISWRGLKTNTALLKRSNQFGLRHIKSASFAR